MKILCAYNANVDALYSITGEEVSAMLASADGADVMGKITTPTGVINSISDFLAGLLFCMKEGTGAEWLIHEPEVFKRLKDQFIHRSKLRMGGNMGIMANVLSEMGAELVVPNVVNPTERQLSFFPKRQFIFRDLIPVLRKQFMKMMNPYTSCSISKKGNMWNLDISVSQFQGRTVS